MDKRLRKRNVLRDIPYVRDPVNIETSEIDQPSSLVERVKRLSNPGWFVSFALHLILLIALGLWILPSVIDRPIGLMVEAVNAEQLEGIDLSSIKIPIEDRSSLAIDEFAEVEFQDELVNQDVLEADLDETDALEIDAMAEGELIEVTGVVESGATNPPANPAAEAIQSRVSKAGGKQGEVQFSLVWETISDLDIHVITPQGQRIFYGARKSNCRGHLDVDANARNRKKFTTEPVENIRWLKGQPDSGRYTVIVHYYQRRGGHKEIEYEMMAKTGENVDVVKKPIDFRDRIHVYRYVFFDGSYSDDDRERLTAKLKKLQENEEQAAQQIMDSIPQQRPAARTTTLRRVITNYPHTDAAIEALKQLEGDGK